MAAENQVQPRKSRCKTILLLCMLLLIGGIGAEGYLLLRRAENGIRIIGRDPAAELLDAVRSRNYETARILRLTDYPDGNVPEEITAELTAQAQEIRDNYFAGNTDADSAKSQIQAIIQLDISSLTETVQSFYEEIRTREAWMLLIQKADAAYAAGDYTAAFQLYRKLPKNDQSLLPYYQEQLEQNTVCLTWQKVKDISAAEQNHDYDTAISLAENMLRLYDGKSDFWEAFLSAVQKNQQQYQYLDACRNTRICFDSGEYTKAFEVLQSLSDTLPDDSPYDALLADTRQSYEDAYFRMRSLQMQTLLKEGDLTQAEQIVIEAETLFPNVPEPAAFREQLRQAAPQELIAFGEPVLSDFTQTDAALTGSDGRTYQSESGNLFCSYEGKASGRKSCSAVFRIGGGFRRLMLTAVPLDSFADDLTVLLTVSADEKELETYAVSRKNGVLHIDLDITGSDRISLRVKPSGTDADLRSAGVILADARVQS